MRMRRLGGWSVVVALAAGCARAGPGPGTQAPEGAAQVTAAPEVAAATSVVAPPSEADLQAALARDVRDARAYEGLARLYYERSLSQSSSAILARQIVAQGIAVLARDGRVSADLLTTRGLLELADGRPDRALQDFAAAAAADPGDLRAQEALGVLAVKVRDYARARGAFAAIVAARGESDLAALTALGAAHAGLGEFVAAEAAYRRVVAQAPDDPWTHYRLALLLRLRGEPEEEYDREIRRAYQLAGDDPRYAEVRLLAEERGATRYFACYYPIGTFYGTAEEHRMWLDLQVAPPKQSTMARLLEMERQAAEIERQRALEKKAIEAGAAPGEASAPAGEASAPAK